jgi:hypothetical protein
MQPLLAGDVDVQAHSLYQLSTPCRTAVMSPQHTDPCGASYDTGTIPESYSRLTRLQVLNLAYNGWTDFGFSEWQPQLQQ